MNKHTHGTPKNRVRGTHCTVERHNGQFCDAPSAEDMPFPICARHAIKLYLWMRDTITATDPMLPVWQALRAQQEQADREQERARQLKHVVYYVQVGDLIKIGYTSNFRLRMRAYPPSRRVLAVEDGDGNLERIRHMQFASARRYGNEWFHPSPALMAHINELRKRHGRPSAAALDIGAADVNAVT